MTKYAAFSRRSCLVRWSSSSQSLPLSPDTPESPEAIQAYVRQYICSLDESNRADRLLELMAPVHEIRHSHDFLGTAYGLLVLYWGFVRGTAIMALVEKNLTRPRDTASYGAVLEHEEYNRLETAELNLRFLEGDPPHHETSRAPQTIEYVALDSFGLVRFPTYAVQRAFTPEVAVFPIAVRALTECTAFFCQLRPITEALGSAVAQQCKEHLMIASAEDGWRTTEMRVVDYAMDKVLGKVPFYQDLLLASSVLALDVMPDNTPAPGHMFLEFAESLKSRRLFQPTTEDLDRWVGDQRARFHRVVPRGAIIGHLLRLDSPPATAIAHLAIKLDQLTNQHPFVLTNPEEYFKALFEAKLPFVPWMNSDDLNLSAGTCSEDDLAAILDYDWRLDVAEQLWDGSDVVCQVVRKGLRANCPPHTPECGLCRGSVLPSPHPDCAFQSALRTFRG